GGPATLRDHPPAAHPLVPMQPRRDFVRLASITLAAYALLGGLVSFAGWALGIPRFIDWWNVGITIKTNTSLCIAALGAAMLLFHLRARLASVALAMLAGAVGFASMLQHLLGIDIGVDTLLFNEAPGSPATTSPNRMGPPSA